MMSMTDGDCQRIRRVRPGKLHARQLHFDHMRDLVLIRMAHANNRFLDAVWGVFTDLKAELRWHKQSDAARLPQFKRAGTVLVYKCLLNRSLIRLVRLDDLANLIVQGQQTFSQIITI